MEGESGIKKLQVLVALPVGIGQGSPYGYHTRIEPCIALAQTTREAEISILAGEHTEASADDFFVIFYHKDFGSFLMRVFLSKQMKQMQVGEVSANLVGVMFLQHLEERVNLFLRLGRFGYGTSFFCPFDLAEARWLDACLGGRLCREL